MDFKQKNIALSALEFYGPEAQIIKAIEELAEVQQALAKYLNSSEKHTPLIDNILEEIADVYIMFAQMEALFNGKGVKDVETNIRLKIDRLYERIEEEKERNNV